MRRDIPLYKEMRIERFISETQQNWANHATRVPQFRHYFANPYEPTLAAGSMLGDWTMTDANGKPFTLYAYDTPLRAASGKRLAHLMRVPALSPPGSARRHTVTNPDEA